MFSQACVKNSVHRGGVCLWIQGVYTPLGRYPLADTPTGRHSLSREGHYSRRYASYWNAFLLQNVITSKVFKGLLSCAECEYGSVGPLPDGQDTNR